MAVYHAANWASEPTEWTPELVAIADQRFDLFNSDSDLAVEYARASRFFEAREIIASDPGFISPFILFYYEKMIHHAWRFVFDHFPMLTVGEAAFEFAHAPFAVDAIDEFEPGTFIEFMHIAREKYEPYSALAWAILLVRYSASYGNRSTDVFENDYSGLSFVEAAPFIELGLADPAAIRAAIDNNIDINLVSQVV